MNPSRTKRRKCCGINGGKSDNRRAITERERKGRTNGKLARQHCTAAGEEMVGAGRVLSQFSPFAVISHLISSPPSRGSSTFNMEFHHLALGRVTPDIITGTESPCFPFSPLQLSVWRPSPLNALKLKRIIYHVSCGCDGPDRHLARLNSRCTWLGMARGQALSQSKLDSNHRTI